MAKALMGHVGFALDVRAADELRSLRERVRRLQSENDQLRQTNLALQDELHDLRLQQEMLALSAERQLDVDQPAAQPALA
jgi:cell division protein FtsB